MTRRRRLRWVYLLGSLLLLVPSLHAQTAYSAPGDPPIGSPAGAVYELPLEQGRTDAAPRPPGSSSSDSGAASESGSLYRTENNFGSSSVVPGLATAAAGAAAIGPGGGVGGSGTGADGDAVGSDAVAGLGTPARQVSDVGNTSAAGGVALLGAIGLLAAGVGALSRRFSQR